ncbi:MAG: hypothetical protein MMC33_005340 [Icmadophila ericetorum]|nr:hypothetical protein [Icmadophila ericetorum]
MAPIPYLDDSLSTVVLSTLAVPFHVETDPYPSLRKRAPSSPTQYAQANPVIPPTSIDNKGVLALFGLISASFVLASIWFFFWAKNGGFHFRKGDWEEYKSTVLRRRGPNGTTLSNGTKSTDLGGGSIVGSAASQDDVEFVDIVSEKAHHVKAGKGRRKKKQQKNSHDDDVRAYRHEKPAKVGGLNREADGSYHDYSTTTPSEPTSARPYSSVPNPSPVTPQKPKNQKNPVYSTPASESAYSAYSDDSHRPLRSSPIHAAAGASANNTPTHVPHSRPRSRQQSPIKIVQPSGQYAPQHNTHNKMPRHASQRNTASSASYTEPLDFESRYSAPSEAENQRQHTKAYFHPIPELVGFRRGGGRRRDSLSESDGETGLS